MRSDTAAQTAATLFITVVMTAAMIVIDRAGPPIETARFPSARVGDSHDVLRVPLTLADRLGEAGERRTQPGGRGTAANTTGTPAIATAGPTLQALAGAPDGGRATSRAPDPTTASGRQRDHSSPGANGRGTTDRRGENPSRPGDRTRPTGQAKHDDRGRSGADTHGRGRDGGVRDRSTNGPRDGSPGNADKARRKHTAAQRDHTDRKDAVQRDRRKSVNGKPDWVRRRHAARPHR